MDFSFQRVETSKDPFKHLVDALPRKNAAHVSYEDEGFRDED